MAKDQIDILFAIMEFVTETLEEPAGDSPKEDCDRLVRALKCIERTIEPYAKVRTLQ